MSPFDGLTQRRVDAGSTSIVWSASPTAPTSVNVAGGGATVLWGDAIKAGAGGFADARAVGASWSGSTPTAYDGFHAAVSVDAAGRITAGADILGLFPVYYTAAGDVRMVASSPESFRSHESFSSRVSVEGLVTVLMLCGPFEGPCLLDGVRRLRRGRVLEWRVNESPREVTQYDLPVAQQHAHLSFDDQIDLLFHATDDTLRRHNPDAARHGLLLSGGRDSRLLAGCLAAQGADIDAFTIGLPTDFEIECSRLVARELGFAHHTARPRDEGFPSYAKRAARVEHLSAGMGTIDTWGYVEPSRVLPARSSNGYSRGREVLLMPRDFDAMLERLSYRGIPTATLRALLRDDAAVDGVVARLRSMYDAVDADDRAEAGFQLSMAAYHRFYIGGIPWRLSFGSWPVMTVLDRAFLDAWIGIPISVLCDRGIIEPMLQRYFPRLAKLPLDRNAFSTRPIAPSLGYRVRERISARLPQAPAPDVGERRQYYRQYDFDNPGWRAIRRSAEPMRDALAEWFDMTAVNRVLPSPDVSANIADPMHDGFDAKTLTGFMLWLDATAAR